MEEIRVPIADESGSIVQQRFFNFLRTFSLVADVEEVELTTQQRLMNDYMNQIAAMVQTNKSTVYVDFQHLVEADFELAEAIEMEYFRFDPYLRHAVHEIVALDNQNYIFDVDKGQREFFVSFYNFTRVERIRAMNTDKIGRLISISGTVTRSSEVRPELLYGSFTCNGCGAAHPSVEQQFQFTEPITCKNPTCRKSNFLINLDKCVFVDWQRLRLQENADEIPAGSMPRCIDVICRNEIVEIAKAGDKVVLVGSVAVIPEVPDKGKVGESTVTGRTGQGRGEAFGDGVQGLKKLGCREMTYKMVFIASSIQHTDQRSGAAISSILAANALEFGGISGNTGGFSGVGDGDTPLELSESERRTIMEMSESNRLYNKMVESICPSVFGHEEIKRGILLMLFGGVHKKTTEGISLRGDLNVCIVGDPSCAKSQFLKYVHGFLPRTVYTSGKASSAAGLTATVVRDAETGEFCVEAGALMLADNGICCIDEFDKMDPNDQVAIHEAMEQQTISITKAGIQATLNARTSVLAAANPVFGRYDRTKTLKANIAVSAAIMSRFDLFFVILDECNPTIDEAIARHIISVHKQGGVKEVASQVPFTREQIQKYVQYARTINPTLSAKSRIALVECYRLLRSNDIMGKNRTAYRITVRQLESLVRLSEAMARLHLDEVVQPVYVKEAYRLLQKSIIFVETEDIELEDNEEEMDGIHRTSRRNKRSRPGGVSDHHNSDDEGGDNDDGMPGGGFAGQSLPQDLSPSASAQGHDSHSSTTVSMNISPTGGQYLQPAVSEDTSNNVAMTVVADTTTTTTSNSTSQPPHVPPTGGSAAKTTPTSVSMVVAPPPPPEIPQQPTKTKSSISAREYEEVTNMLALRLKELEASNTSDIFEGCPWNDLLSWYLHQRQDELLSVDAFEQKKKQINQVIRRMIKHEGSVVLSERIMSEEEEQKEREDANKDESVVSSADTNAAAPTDRRMLRLHPSYQI